MAEWLGWASVLLLPLTFTHRRHWQALLQSAVLQRRVLLIALVLTALWSMRAGLHPLLQFHFLGLTLTTLMLGPEGALLAGVLAWLTRALLGMESFALAGEWLLAWVCLPVALTQGMHVLVQKYLPHNYFIFFFITGFFTAMLSAIVAMLAWGALLTLGGTLEAQRIQEEFLFLIPLMLFGEGFLNGLNLAIFVVYRPQWVQAFNDRLYLPYKQDV